MSSEHPTSIEAFWHAKRIIQVTLGETYYVPYVPENDQEHFPKEKIEIRKYVMLLGPHDIRYPPNYLVIRFGYGQITESLVIRSVRLFIDGQDVQ